MCRCVGAQVAPGVSRGSSGGVPRGCVYGPDIGDVPRMCVDGPDGVGAWRLERRCGSW